MRGKRAIGRLLGVAVGAGLLGPAVAAPAQAGGLPRLLVSPPRVDPGLAPLARGHRALELLAKDPAPADAAAVGARLQAILRAAVRRS